MLERYKEITFKNKTLQQIDRINGIIEEYLDAGYTLTVRQLYYQLVARDIIPNNEKSYKQTTSIVNDARIAGLIDWDAIEDRTRSFEQRIHHALHAHAGSYHVYPVPDVRGVYYGRDVGYAVERIELPPEVEAIRATDIRAQEQRA